MLDKNYKFYLFDLDRTLWNFNKNAESAVFKIIDVLKMPELFGITNKKQFFDNYEDINHVLWAKYDKGEITKDYLRVNRFLFTYQNYLNGTYGKVNKSLPAYSWTQEQLLEYAIKTGNTYLEHMTYETALEDGAMQVLQTLKKQGAKIAIVTNGFKEVQYGKLKNSNIIEYMDAIIISEEVGAHKPNPLIFEKALQALCTTEYYNSNPQKAKDEAIMIGDDYPNDIAGAQTFGIDQFYYNPNHNQYINKPTYMGESLLDIIK